MRGAYRVHFGRSILTVIGCLWLALDVGCISRQRITYPPGTTEPLLGGLGDHHFKVSTDSPLAQRYFNQGLVMRYGFAFRAARQAFEQAAALDPDCAMAWWGVAWSVGPTFWRMGFWEMRNQIGWEAIQRAQALKGNASPLEKQLIDAVSSWYASPPVADRKPLNRAYADAMRELWQAHPDNTEIGTLYAEALVAISRDDLWRWDGHTKQNVRDIVAILEDVLAKDPNHPGANHLYIHAVEASPTFRSGQQAANRLRTLYPGAPHLVHMSSHIDIRAGKWDAAIAANERANELTDFYRETLDTNRYSPVWRHNYHFLAFACMMGGQYERGVQAGRAIAKRAFNRMVSRPNERWTAAILYEVHIRFGRWHEMLAEPQPRDDMPYLRTMWHFARTIAHAALGQIDAADQEYDEFQSAYATIPMEDEFYADWAPEVYKLADLVAQGEIAFHRGEQDKAIRLLKAAVEHEDRIKYYEPPLWHQPVRHALGAILVTAGRFEEAEAVFREDLAKWPNNGWSLHGLETCLRARGANAEADQVHAQFAQAWKNADTRIGASCLCVLRTGYP